MLSAGGALLISAGAVMSYLKAQQPEQQMSDLTLANMEVIALGLDQHTEVICRGSGNCKLKCPNCGKFDFGPGHFAGSHSCGIGF